ncbi:hypothetical protein RHGRI_034505 [Rhododendron griersonianum]|uniref:TORTIFOLIA1/SINE1-2 N-terminal domain-containing protein n=1 Tax=Rhododendron griersonianum TaxID=479676 RepID=A0AAV6I5H0_9ERIC|nr:hypothetical protein RHGRI_034505 [Rhododendron griersonianum]
MLSDRDTLSLASAELDSIALALPPHSLSPFLSCLSTASSSSDKSPVKKHCVRLLGLLSSAHGDALSPHLPKILSSLLLPRLRDSASDSALRSACVHSVSLMAQNITKPPFSSFLNPLADAVLHNQDHNSQIGSALCLSAAIEAARGDVERAQLQKLLPRFLKLVRSEGFKAKAAVLAVIGSVVGAGGASSRNVAGSLVAGLGEFLSSEDWAARKAAAEALGRLAVVERDLVAEFKSACLASLESRRFDKVKVVRETMNRTLELWKEVPGDPERLLTRSQSKSSSKGDVGVQCSPSVSRSSSDDSFETPKLKKTPLTSRLPSSDTSFANIALKRSPSKSVDKKPSITTMGKVDVKNNSDWSIKIAVPQPSSLQVASNVDFKDGNVGVVDSITYESSRNLKSETKSVLFSEPCHEKLHKLVGLRSGFHVVPVCEIDDCESDVVKKNSDWSIKIAVPQPSSLQVASNVDFKDGNVGVADSITYESSRNLKSETKRVLFSEPCQKFPKLGGLRSGSRVVPVCEIDDCESDVVQSNAIEDVDGNQKDIEGLNLVRKQLVQIENQQSSLFDLLQRFIGSSQSGMNSLETRVNGLEKALDEISYDLALSSGKISNTESAGNACCLLPAADFLSPKFWKRAEGQYSSRFSFPGRNHSLPAMRSMPNKDAYVEISNLGSPNDRCQSWDRFVASPVANPHRNLRGGLKSCSSKNLKISQDADKLIACGVGGLEGNLIPSCTAAANMIRR